MKRYTPFAQLTESLTAQTSMLAYHPNNFFIEEDEYRFMKNAIQSLEQISQRFDTPASPTERLFHSQLDQLREELASAQNDCSDSVGLNPC